MVCMSYMRSVGVVIGGRDLSPGHIDAPLDLLLAARHHRVWGISSAGQTAQLRDIVRCSIRYSE